MSEPIQKGEVDLKSLDQALKDEEAASEVPAETLQKNSDTLAQPAVDASPLSANNTLSTEPAPEALSPATLSPSSPRTISPPPVAAQATANVPPAVSELKSMFPDLETDTIAAVLSSRGGDQESAINALLQMSDPNFKPATPDTRTDSDALLAQTLAMEEQQRQQHMAGKQQQQNQSSGRGGGGAGSFFGGLLHSDSREQTVPSTPSYDPNALTYQPRVRKAPQAAAGARTSYAPPDHVAAASPSYTEGEGVGAGKQWQDEINRMAGTGLAKAASTFSSFRQKASAAFNNPQEDTAGTAHAGASGGNGNSAGAGAGFMQAFQNFRNNTGRSSNSADEKASAPLASSRLRFTSPRSPHASEYDQDPSPVSENELAKIISRGGAGGASGAALDRSGGGKARTLSERYGLGIKNAGRASPSTSPSATGNSTDISDFAGWDQAGRTAISIKDNTAANSGPLTSEAEKKHFDSTHGRASPSSRPDPTASKEAAPPSASTASAAAVGSVGAAGVGPDAAMHAKRDDDDAGDDSDDLEYVSNPFEDED